MYEQTSRHTYMSLQNLILYKYYQLFILVFKIRPTKICFTQYMYFQNKISTGKQQAITYLVQFFSKQTKESIIYICEIKHVTVEMTLKYFCNTWLCLFLIMGKRLFLFQTNPKAKFPKLQSVKITRTAISYEHLHSMYEGQ